MSNIARPWIPAILALSIVLLTSAFIACGGNEEAGEDVPTVPAAAGTSGAASSAATSMAELPNTSGVSLDEYITMVCGETVTEVNSWEGGDSLRDLSAGLGFINEQMSALEPPTEVAEWHHAQLAFAEIFKETVDDFLEDPGDQTEDEFLLSMFFTVAPEFAPVEEAIAGMNPEVRARMVEAGCIDDGTSDPSMDVMAEPERTDISVGGSVSGQLVEPDRSAFLQFQAEMGQRYLIEFTWQGFPEFYALIKDPPDPVVNYITQVNPDGSPHLRRWTAPESGTFHIEVYAVEGTGSFTVSISVDPAPDSPANVTAVREGSAIAVSWDPVAGAQHYIVYHDDRGPGCRLGDDGRPIFCGQLASDVVGTSYTHADPDRNDNFYFVVACNSEGCSRIDSNNPATP